MTWSPLTLAVMTWSPLTLATAKMSELQAENLGLKKRLGGAKVLTALTALTAAAAVRPYSGCP